MSSHFDNSSGTIGRSWRDRLRPILFRYGTALAVALGTVLARFWLDPYLEGSGFVVTLTGVLLAAWLGGLGPALLSQTLMLLTAMAWFGTPGAGATNPVRALAGLVAFYAVGIAVGILSESTRAAQRRARAQADLAVAQWEQLQATLSCIADGVLVTDQQGRLTMVNPVAEKLTGWSRFAAVGLPHGDVFVAGGELAQQPAASPIQLVLQAGQIVQGDVGLVLTGKDGSQIPINYSAAPIRNVQGRTTGAVLIFRDETERRRSEQALRDADQRKNEFLATLAHELRNPLAPIRTGLEIMKLSVGEPELFEEVRSTMERQTQQMVRLIDDLLDVSRITCGKLQLRRCPVELPEVVRNAVDSARPWIDESGHQLTVTLPDAAAIVSADPNRLAQVLSNLLHNAAKYTPSGGKIWLTASTRGNDVSISVKDTGIGIPAEMLDRVFEMFIQVDRSLEHGYTGLGIGLTLVNSLVKMHGGSVEVHSDGPGLGSEFIVQLPNVLQSTTEESRPALQGQPAAGALTLRLLLVDDNADALETLCTMVKILGSEVRTARDGVEAVEAAEEFRPDAILMDLGMPRMDGYEAARQIREQPWGRETLLIALTGWGQDEDKRRTREAGFDHHLVKPVEPRVLREVLAARLEQVVPVENN